MQIPDFSKFELMTLILLVGIVLLVMLVSFQVGRLTKRLKEIQANQQLVAKYINDIRRGGDVALEDKDLV